MRLVCGGWVAAGLCGGRSLRGFACGRGALHVGGGALRVLGVARVRLCGNARGVGVRA